MKRNFSNSAQHYADYLASTIKQGTPKFRKQWIAYLVKEFIKVGLIHELVEAIEKTTLEAKP